MLIRALPLALAALALAAPGASAAVSDRYLPIYDAGDGVTVETRGFAVFARFAPKAARIYRRIGGRNAYTACGRVQVPRTGGPPTSGGYGATTRKLPRARTRVTLEDGLNERPVDLCTIATARERSDRRCIPNGTDDPRCVRVIIAVTELARAYLDARARAIDLWLVKEHLPIALTEPSPLAELHRFIGADIVGLATADAPPPPGQVGAYIHGDDYALSALLADGRRQFVQLIGGVYSTNVHEFIRGEDADHTVFSVFL